MKLETLLCSGVLFCAGLAAGCGTSEDGGASAAASVIRLTEYLDRASLESPLNDSTASAEVEALRDAYAARELAGDAWGRGDLPPWLLKRVPLLVDERRRFEDRVALFLPPPSRLALPIRIPDACRLRLHLGMMIEVGRFDPSRASLEISHPELIRTETLDTDGTRFEVSFRPEGQEERLLLRRYLDPRNRSADREWVRVEADLAELAGLSGELVFRTYGSEDPDGVQDSRFDLAFVSDPVLVPAVSPVPAGERPKNVLLIGVDTLRADHMSAYGYARPTSPNLERLASEGVRFERAIAAAPWTLPSFTSILTSLYPSRHGAGRGGRGGYTRVHPDALLLSEVLYGRGYLTAGLVANPFVSPGFGLDQGYVTYTHPNYALFPNVMQAMRDGKIESAREDADRLIGFLREHRDVPFFFFWHIIDPHLPYHVPEAFASRFVDPGYEGQFRDYVDFEYLVQRPGRRRFAHEGPPPIPPMSEADARQITDLYDAEIAETDAEVGRVFDALRDLGLWESTVVVFTSDHGEGLAEHGHYHHGYTLYEDQVRVPLIVRVPGGPRGQVHEGVVSTVDVGPMILEALGIPAPADMQGTNRLVRPGGPPVFSEAPTYDSSALKAVYLGAEKYLHDPVFKKEEVFRPAEDPVEAHDVLAASADFVARARPLLDRFREHNLRPGRYHLLFSTPAGARLSGRLVAGDVFDANALLLAGGTDTAVELDLDRKTLSFETPCPTGRAELVFWCRGKDLRLEIEVDGTPLPSSAIHLGGGQAQTASPVLGTYGLVETNRIPVARGSDLVPLAETSAILWMEGAGLRPLDTTTTPEETERLRALGYVE